MIENGDIELIALYCDGMITEEQFAQLENRLRESRALRDVYRSYMNLHAALHSHLTVDSLVEANLQELDIAPETNVLREFLEREFANDKNKTVDQSAKETRERVLGIKQDRPVSAVRTMPSILSILRAAGAVLALVMFLVFIEYLSQQNKDIPFYATLAETNNARWADSDLAVQVGDAFSKKQFLLLEGSVRFKFKYGAEVVLQGPARFDLVNGNRVYLHRGELVASVPERATGFTVEMLGATVVDLGTEFGASVDNEGNCEVGVFRGKVSLFPGPSGSKMEGVKILADQVKHVNVITADVSDISVYKSVFAQKLLPPYKLAVLDSNPYAYWRFDGDLASPVYNIMDNSKYNGQYVGNCRLEAVGPDLGDGQPNSALVLNGRDSNVEIKNVEHEQTENYSIVLWVRPDVIANQMVIANTNELGTVVKDERELQISEDGHFIHYDFREGDPRDLDEYKRLVVKGRTSIRPGQWYHVVMTGDENGQMRLFVNGQEDGKPVTSVGFLGGYFLDIHIGTKAVVHSTRIVLNRFRGAVDEISRYDRVLSEEEIRRLYQSGNRQYIN